MPTIKATTALAANAQANPLVGSQYEYLPWPAKVDFAILADTGGVVEANVQSGSDILMQNTQIDEKALGTPISSRDDIVVTDIAAPGERLGVHIREVAGAATTVRTQVWITPL